MFLLEENMNIILYSITLKDSRTFLNNKFNVFNNDVQNVIYKTPKAKKNHIKKQSSLY